MMNDILCLSLSTCPRPLTNQSCLSTLFGLKGLTSGQPKTFWAIETKMIGQLIESKPKLTNKETKLTSWTGHLLWSIPKTNWT